MKTKQFFTLVITLMMITSLVVTTQAQKKYKMTTQIPDNVLIPDKVETRL